MLTTARFVPVRATELPPIVRFRSFGVLSARPKQAAWTLATGYAYLACELLARIRGMSRQEYQCVAKAEVCVNVGTNLFQSVRHPVAEIVFEAQSQNGAEVISAIWETLNKANTTGAMIRVGPVQEPNAHAAAFAVAWQIANEVCAGEPVTIVGSDLEHLARLLNAECRNIIDFFASTADVEGADKHPIKQDDLDIVRQAVDRLRDANGIDAIPGSIIKATHFGNQKCRNLLRQLEAVGQYSGFVRSRPKCYKRSDGSEP